MSAAVAARYQNQWDRGPVHTSQHGAMENPCQLSPSDNLLPLHEPKRGVPIGLNPTHLSANRGHGNLRTLTDERARVSSREP